jgi:putative transposase
VPGVHEEFTRRSRPLFFVTICTIQRRRLLASNAVHERFVQFCGNSPEKIQVLIGKYVIMPDHIHVFVSAEGSASLSRWVGSLKGFLSSGMRKEAVQEPHWQDGFFDHLLRDGEGYSEKWSYVEQNPVRAGLVSDAGKWAFMGEISQLSW